MIKNEVFKNKDFKDKERKLRENLRLANEVELIGDFVRLFEERLFCDVTFMVQDVEFQAHVSILQARVPNFSKLFLPNLSSPSVQSCINIHDSQSETFAVFLRSVYTVNNVQDYCEVKSPCTETVSSSNPSDDMKSIENGKSEFEDSLDESMQREDGVKRDGIHNTFSPHSSIDVCCKIGQDLVHLIDDIQSSDITFVLSDDKKVRAHRAILCARSSYFSAMLFGDWSEKEASEIQLVGINYQAFMVMLHFLYGGIASIPLESASDICDVLYLADMYGVNGLKDVVLCELKLVKCHLFHKPCADCTSGVLECLEVSEVFHLEELKKQCEKWVVKYFDRIYSTKSFAYLTQNLQERIQSSLQLSINRLNVIDLLIRGDKVSTTLPRIKWSEPVLDLISLHIDSCLSFIAANFPVMMSDQSFLDMMKGVGWRTPLLEKIFNAVSGSLTVQNCCERLKVAIKLQNNISFITNNEGDDQISEEAADMVRKLHTTCQSFIVSNLHRVSHTDGWNHLSPRTQTEIRKSEGGMFVDLGLPRQRNRTFPSSTTRKSIPSRNDASSEGNTARKSMSARATSKNNRGRSIPSRNDASSEGKEGNTARKSISARATSTNTRGRSISARNNASSIGNTTRKSMSARPTSANLTGKSISARNNASSIGNTTRKSMSAREASTSITGKASLSTCNGASREGNSTGKSMSTRPTSANIKEKSINARNDASIIGNPTRKSMSGRNTAATTGNSEKQTMSSGATGFNTTEKSISHRKYVPSAEKSSIKSMSSRGAAAHTKITRKSLSTSKNTPSVATRTTTKAVDKRLNALKNNTLGHNNSNGACQDVNKSKSTKEKKAPNLKASSKNSCLNTNSSRTSHVKSKCGRNTSDCLSDSKKLTETNITKQGNGTSKAEGNYEGKIKSKTKEKAEESKISVVEAVDVQTPSTGDVDVLGLGNKDESESLNTEDLSGTCSDVTAASIVNTTWTIEPSVYLDCNKTMNNKTENIAESIVVSPTLGQGQGTSQMASTDPSTNLTKEPLASDTKDLDQGQETSEMVSTEESTNLAKEPLVCHTNDLEQGLETTEMVTTEASTNLTRESLTSETRDVDQMHSTSEIACKEAGTKQTKEPLASQTRDLHQGHDTPEMACNEARANQTEEPLASQTRDLDKVHDTSEMACNEARTNQTSQTNGSLSTLVDNTNVKENDISVPTFNVHDHDMSLSNLAVSKSRNKITWKMVPSYSKVDLEIDNDDSLYTNKNTPLPVNSSAPQGLNENKKDCISARASSQDVQVITVDTRSGQLLCTTIHEQDIDPSINEQVLIDKPSLYHTAVHELEDSAENPALRESLDSITSNSLNNRESEAAKSGNPLENASKDGSLNSMPNCLKNREYEAVQHLSVMPQEPGNLLENTSTERPLESITSSDPDPQGAESVRNLSHKV